MRVAVLVAHGVKPDLAREVAIEQLNVESAQNLREREARGEITRGEKRDERREDLELKYDGVEFEVADVFEDIANNTVHERGHSSSGKKKHGKKKPPPWNPFTQR